MNVRLLTTASLALPVLLGLSGCGHGSAQATTQASSHGPTQAQAVTSQATAPEDATSAAGLNDAGPCHGCGVITEIIDVPLTLQDGSAGRHGAMVGHEQFTFTNAAHHRSTVTPLAGEAAAEGLSRVSIAMRDGGNETVMLESVQGFSVGSTVRLRRGRLVHHDALSTASIVTEGGAR